MYNFVWLLLLGCLFSPLVSYAASQPLKAGGVAVGFVKWAPVKASYHYKQLSINEERHTALAKQGHQYMIPLSRYKIRFRANGDVEVINTRSRYILSQEGVQNHGNYSFWVDSFSSQTNIRQAYTILPDGKRVFIDPETVQIQTASDNNIFSDSFKVIIPYSHLAPGAVMLIETKTVYPAKRSVMPWSRTIYPYIFHIRDRLEVVIEWENNKVKPQWKTDYEGLSCRTETPARTKCVAASTGIYPDDPDVGNYDDILPQLVITRKGTWSAISQKMRKVVNSRLSSNKAMRQKVARLIKGARTDEQKIQRLHEFVTRDIRYVGFEHGYGGIVPRPTSLTLKRRYGDCKDKASLFVDMARIAGLNAYTVLTSTERKNTDKLLSPSASYFNHMVACVDLKEKKEVCVDLTDSYNSSMQLSANMQGAVRLDVREGTSLISKLPQDKYKWKIKVDSTNQFTKNGSIHESQEVSYNAATAGWLRGELSSLTHNDRIKWVENNYKDVVTDKIKLKVSIKGLDKLVNNVVLASKAEFENVVKNYDELKRYTENESWLLTYLKGTKSKNKNHPYTLWGYHYNSAIKYKLLKNQKIAYHGPEIQFTTEHGYYRRRYEAVSDGVVIHTDVSLPNRKIPIAELAKFNSFIDHILENNKIEIGLSNR